MNRKTNKLNFLPETLSEYNVSVVADLVNIPMTSEKKIKTVESFISKYKCSFTWLPLYLTKDESHLFIYKKLIEKYLFIYKKLITGCLGRIQVLDHKFDEKGKIIAHGVVYGITISHISSKTDEPYLFTWVDTDARFDQEKEKKNNY